MIFRHLSGFQITGTSVSKNNKVLITSEGLLGCSSLLIIANIVMIVLLSI